MQNLEASTPSLAPAQEKEESLYDSYLNEKGKRDFSITKENGRFHEKPKAQESFEHDKETKSDK